MNKFISRIICVCLSCCLLFCFTFNVSASSDFYSLNWLDYATLNDEGSNYINLTSNDGEFTYFSPFKERMYGSELLVKLSGTTDCVTSLSVVDEDGTSYTAQKLHLGSGYYRFLWNCGGHVIESLTFQFTLNTDSTTFCSVMQLRSSAYDVLYFSPKFDAHVHLTDANGEDEIFPFLNVNTFSTYDNEGILSATSYRIDINMSDWKKYDYIDFNFSVTSSNIMSIYCVVNQKVVVPTTVNEIYSNSSGSLYLSYNCTVSCDLTSVPKEGLLTLIVRGAISPEELTNSPFGCICSSVTGYIKSDSFTNPLYYWLAELTSNTSGLSAALGMINNAINSFKQAYNTGVNNIIGFMGEFYDGVVTYINNLIRTIQQQFANLGTFLTNLFNPRGSLDAPADLQDSLADQGGQLENIDQELNSVNKVEADDINMDISTIVNTNVSTSVLAGLSYVMGTPYIIKIFTLLFTFTIIGYILYGKR